MKKIIKDNIKIIITIIICAVVFTGFGVYAAYNYYAKDISFTPSNESWEVDNVEDALNDLYTSKKSTIKYATGNGVEGSKTINVNNFVIGEYYLCTSNTKGLIDTYLINGAEMIYEYHNYSHLDYLYSNYLMYIKAEATTISFSYTSNASNSGMNVRCYQFE